MNPELLQQGLYLTLGMSLAAPATHAWSCWSSGQFPRYPALSVGLSLASAFNAVLLTIYKGSPDAIGFAAPGVLYLMYLWFPAGEFAPAGGGMKSGDSFGVNLPELSLPAAVIVNSGTREPFSRLELRALESVVYELTLANISLVAICADKPNHLADFKLHREISYPVHPDPDFSICRALGCTGEAPGADPIPAFFFVDKDGIVRLSHYSTHICERIGPETMITQLEKNAGVVFPLLDSETPESGLAGN